MSFTPAELRLLALSDACQNGEQNPRLVLHKVNHVRESLVRYGKTGVRSRIRATYSDWDGPEEVQRMPRQRGGKGLG